MKLKLILAALLFTVFAACSSDNAKQEEEQILEEMETLDSLDQSLENTTTTLDSISENLNEIDSLLNDI